MSIKEDLNIHFKDEENRMLLEITTLYKRLAGLNKKEVLAFEITNLTSVIRFLMERIEKLEDSRK